MSWKKNVFSYILWIVYTLAVSLGILGFFGVGLGLLESQQEYLFLAIGIAYLIVGLLVFGVHKLVNKRQRCQAATGIVPLIVEAVAVVALFAAGILVRVALLPNLTGDGADMIYYEAAKVAEGNSVPMVLHGATYIYLQLLHVIFLFFGNRLTAAIGLQIALVCMAGIFLYCAIRELAGRIPAIVATGVLMISPYMLLRTMELSPEILYLLIYAIGLWLVADGLKKNACNPMAYVAVGLIIGVCCYLDLTGITLLVLAAGVFTVNREAPINIWNKRWIAFLLNLLGVLLGWFVIIVLDASLCGKEIFAVMSAWLQQYQPGAFSLALPNLRYYIFSEQDRMMSYAFSNGMVWEGRVLYALFVFGIFSFWCRRRQERQCIWVGTVAVLILLHCFQMVTPEVTGSTYLYLFMAALAAVGVVDVFAVNHVTENALAETSAEEEIAETEVDTADMNVVEGQDDKERYVEMTDKEGEAEVALPKVQFLENPLPLPKKHEAKVMDYRITDIAEDDFDYDVAADDDYDI